jgi:hypothetical protein
VAASYAADGADPIPSPANAAADGPDRPTRRGRHMPCTLLGAGLPPPPRSRRRRPPAPLQATAAARRSRQLHRGPHGHCGDRPVGPSGRPVGQAARARATQQRAIGLPLRPLTRAARDSRARSPPPPCLLLLPSRFALRNSAATVTVACLH